MKITFVGTFEDYELRTLDTHAHLIKFIPFEKGRIEELKHDVMKFKGYTAKITFNADSKPIKVIFRKDKKEKNNARK